MRHRQVASDPKGDPSISVTHPKPPLPSPRMPLPPTPQHATTQSNTTFLTEIKSPSQHTLKSPSRSSKKRQILNATVPVKKTQLRDIKLESSADIPVMLATIIASEKRSIATPSADTQNISSFVQYFENDATGEHQSYYKRIPGVPLKSQTARSVNVNYQPLSRPQDRTLYRIQDFRDRNLSEEDRNVIERERMARLMERQRHAREMRPKIPGNVQMNKLIGREEHFYSKFIAPSAYDRLRRIEEERNATQKKKENAMLMNAPFAWQDAATSDEASGENSIYLFDSNRQMQRQQQEDAARQRDSVNESYLRELEFNPEMPRTIPGHVKFDRNVGRDAHFYTKLLYREKSDEKSDRWTHVSSTCVFDPKRAKVDPLLNQGSTLNWSRMCERQPLQFVHYDTDYDPIPVLPHSAHADFSNQTGRDVSAPFMAQRKVTYTPGEYDPNESSVRGKVKGGKWSKSVARPAPRLASGELYHYDRILKRLHDKKRKERRVKRKNVITEDDLRRGLSFGV